MRITVLTNDLASGIYLAEHGFSLFIEIDEVNILFDTGHSDTFLQNARLLNIDLNKIDYIVLSHGHWDHGNGLKFLSEKKIICHPKTFISRYSKISGNNIGLDIPKEEILKKFDLIEANKPYKITDNILFLGEISRKNDFESKNTDYIDEKGIDDYITDDSALILVINGELVVITGCSHSGICNIIEYSKEVTGINKINSVIGGLHLLRSDDVLTKTIKYLKSQKIKQLLPAHCTGLPALSLLYNEFNISEVKSGMSWNF